MIVNIAPGHRISPSKGGATWQVTITKSAIPKEKTLAGVCLSLLGASPLVPTDTPPPFSSRLSRCSHLDCRAARILPARHTPARRIAAHRIIRTFEPFARKQIMDTRHPQPVAATSRLVLLEKRIEPFLIGANPR